MKNVILSTLAATAFIASSAAFANDLVAEDKFYDTVLDKVETSDISVASSFGSIAPSKSSIFANTFGPQNAR